MISKMKHPSEGGGRIAVITNGSPFFTGDAGSGESNIRKWIIENDWLEALIALPGDLFFNTGISTYIWVLSNRKPSDRKGRVQLIDASNTGSSLNKSLNNKRKEISDEAREVILKRYGTTEDTDDVKWFPNEYFGYTKVTVEQPLKENGRVVTNRQRRTQTRFIICGTTNGCPLTEDIEAYFNREVQPHLPESWVEWDKNKVGYEINFTKYFYTYKPLRSLQGNHLRPHEDAGGQQSENLHVPNRGAMERYEAYRRFRGSMDCSRDSDSHWRDPPQYTQVFSTTMKRTNTVDGEDTDEYPVLCLTDEGVVIRDVETGNHGISYPASFRDITQRYILDEEI